MALIKSTILSAISGSVNGITFARNKGGAYMRNRTMGLNPQTEKQSGVRILFANVAQAWRELSEDERITWRDGAPNFPYTNKVGDERIYTGEQLFIKLNRGRQVMGLSQLDICPTPVSVEYPEFDAISGTFDPLDPEATGIQIDMGSAIPAGLKPLVSLAPPVSAGVNKLQRGRYIRVGADVSTNEIVVGPTTTDQPLNPVAGEKRLLYYIWGIEATGQLSEPVFKSFVWEEI